MYAFFDRPFLPPSPPDADLAGCAGPFHTYRSSTDIRPVYGSILVNLMSIPPLAEKNLSVPGCWAYPVCSQRPAPGVFGGCLTAAVLCRTCWKWE